MSRDTIIRDTAYAIWEAEGRPEGRAHQHWLMAEQQVARTTKDDAAAPNGGQPNKNGRGKAAKADPGADTTRKVPARKVPARKTTGKAPAPKAH